MEYILFENIRFQVEYRKVKYARIEYNPLKPRIILAKSQNPLKILSKNKHQILKKYSIAAGDLAEARKIQLQHRSETEFKNIASELVDHCCRMLNLKKTVLKFRKMQRRWGTCYSNGKIILNKNLKFLPQRLIFYIIFHEAAHLIIKGHGKDFKKLIRDQFSDHKQLERSLKLYGLRILGQ